jgi:hypothetical protein
VCPNYLGDLALCLSGVAIAETEEDAEDFMQIHNIEIVLHEAGTTKNLDLMMSLFADDATITSGGKTYSGKDQIRALAISRALSAPEPVGGVHASFPHQIFR